MKALIFFSEPGWMNIETLLLNSPALPSFTRLLPFANPNAQTRSSNFHRFQTSLIRSKRAQIKEEKNMVYGGSGSASTIKQVKLERESELRIEVGDDAPLRLRLLNGTAEIFGTELPPEIWLNFPPRLKFAVFTWHGATIEMDGTTETDYTADETPMVSYANVHAVLHGRRSRAKASSPDDSESSQLLLHSIRTFKANVVLVLGQEKLCSMLKDVLKSDPKVDVVKLKRSGGVVSRNAKVRQKARSYRIRKYFYDLSPHSNIANFSDLFVYRVGGGPQAPRSALPIGAEPAADPTRVVPVNINRDLLHLVLAVSFAKEPDEIISSNVAGFIYVTDIDIQRKKITYLAPSAGELPSKYLIMGSLTWLET